MTAGDMLNDQVLPFFDSQSLPMLRILTDRGTEYCGCVERHDDQLYLAVNDIDPTKTKAKSPRYFQLDSLNQGGTPNIHERIVTLTMEGLGVRALPRILKISLTTVIKHLKKIEPTATHRMPCANRKTDGDSANR